MDSSTSLELAYISILSTIGRRVHEAACKSIAATGFWAIVVFMSVGLVACVPYDVDDARAIR
jgi:hypothetical protein